MIRTLLVSILAAWLILPLAQPAFACPLCKEAISTQDPEEEVNNLPRVYNNSIFLMVGVPYLTLGVVGFAIYRGVKRNGEYASETNSIDQPPR